MYFNRINKVNKINKINKINKTTLFLILYFTISFLQYFFANFSNTSSANTITINLTYSKFQNDYFEKISNNIVACFEYAKVLSSFYDEEGICNDKSLWQMWPTTFNVKSNLKEFKSFNNYSGGDRLIGKYIGEVEFSNEQHFCSLNIEFEYSGEDITLHVDLNSFYCSNFPKTNF